MQDIGGLVKTERFCGQSLISITIPDVLIRHDDVQMLSHPVLKNGIEPDPKEWKHDFRLCPDSEMVGDVTFVRFLGAHSISLNQKLGKQHRWKLMMHPEVCHVIGQFGRKKIKAIGDELTGHHGEKRVFSSRAAFGALASTTKNLDGGCTVAPFISIDELPCGERDRMFFFPLTDGLNLDPNWIVCFVSGLKP